MLAELLDAASSGKEQEGVEDLADMQLNCLLHMENGMNEEGSGNN